MVPCLAVGSVISSRTAVWNVFTLFSSVRRFPSISGAKEILFLCIPGLGTEGVFAPDEYVEGNAGVSVAVVLAGKDKTLKSAILVVRSTSNGELVAQRTPGLNAEVMIRLSLPDGAHPRLEM